jgi:aminoglycoside/choline kinase family phosphotransferase
VTRAAALDAFLEAAGWGGAARRPLAGDASARRYLRLARGGARAILMDTPPESGLTVAPFLAVTDWLRGLGLSAPEVLGEETTAGFVLLEDLGDDLFIRLAADPGREAEIYDAAIDLIADLHAAPPPPPARGWQVPPYDRAVLLREMRLVPEWYMPAAGETSADLAAEFDALIEPIVAIALEGSRSVVYRDYHAENLIWLPQRMGLARVGLLDYQDLLWGHPAYDVISLLEDARRDVAPELAERLLARYVARSGRDREAFERAAHALAAQRNLKILGLFVRLARRDGKGQYLRLLPRVHAHLLRDLDHPELAALRDWVARRLPPPEAVAP